MAKKIEEELRELAAKVPQQEWDKLPADLSDNVDQHIYGALQNKNFAEVYGASKKLAMVGANSPPTFNDQMGLWVAQQEGWLPEFTEVDRINLEDGRDFLAEDHKYVAVILHSIFHAHPEYIKLALEKNDKGISPLHTVEKWRERLILTEASKIIVWEMRSFSLSGWQLSELEGYKILKRDHRVTIYERKRS